MLTFVNYMYLIRLILKNNMSTKTNKSSPDLRFKLHNYGYSVIGWSRANGYSKATVHRALSGKHMGKRAREIRAKVQSLKG